MACAMLLIPACGANITPKKVWRAHSLHTSQVKTYVLPENYMYSSWLTLRRHSALISTGVPSLERKSISMRLNAFD